MIHKQGWEDLQKIDDKVYKRIYLQKCKKIQRTANFFPRDARTYLVWVITFTFLLAHTYIFLTNGLKKFYFVQTLHYNMIYVLSTKKKIRKVFRWPVVIPDGITIGRNLTPRFVEAKFHRVKKNLVPISSMRQKKVFSVKVYLHCLSNSFLSYVLVIAAFDKTILKGL